ncbi:hypothetical protein FDP41_009347 [Naegleria fowleri]|uniref:peptidylprolyl isomerase n=1 Tax=Naegleria fowleri TaxID=5763 RepID=A0A6A5BEG4_NAEFO|nr:uncharacterized protein FDP41_009347 [Naegleria fowleri]KAF0972444.1 hypothetical protein FDP41_009347 [Naegleria fowleri]
MKRSHGESLLSSSPRIKKTKYAAVNQALEEEFMKHPSQDIKEFLENVQVMQWRIRVNPDEPFSLGQVSNCTLSITYCSLQVDSLFDAALPSKVKEREEAKKKLKLILAQEEEEQAKEKEKIPGCVLQACIQDDDKRKKFVLATLTHPLKSETNLNHMFSADEIGNLTFELKGRPYLLKEKCIGVDIHGYVEFSPNATFEDRAKAYFRLKRNYFKEIVEKLKKTKYTDLAPWEKSKVEKYEKQQQQKREEEEEAERLKEDYTEPKEFERQGVKITNVFVGHGRKAQIGDKVTIYYKGRLDPDKVKTFDRCTRKNPFSFRLGTKKVIKGINIGVEGMTVCGIRELVIPPEKGFGEKGIIDKVPPNATLFYDIELLELTPKKQYDKELIDKNKEKQEKEKAKKDKRSANSLVKDLVKEKKKDSTKKKKKSSK